VVSLRLRGHERGQMLGYPLQVNNLGQREYARLIREAQVPRIKFHGLRHTCATLLLNAGEPVHNVSKRLGHKAVTMTMEIYAHCLPESGKQMAATMGAILHG
jgi:integrase